MSKFENVNISDKRLLKSGIGYTIGNFLLKGISFITIPLYTRLLTTYEYGVVSIFNTWLAIFVCIIGLNLSSSISNAYLDFKENYKKFLASILFLSTISFSIIITIFLVFRDNISKLMGFEPLIILSLLVTSFFSYVINFNNAKFMMEYNHSGFIKVSFLVSLLNISLAILFLLFMREERYKSLIYAMLVAYSLVGIYIYIKIVKNVNIKELLNYGFWKYALIIATPTMPHLLSQLILTQSDRIMIEKFIGSSQAGIYSVAYNISMILSVLWGSLNNVWVPWFYEKMRNKNIMEITRKTKFYMIFFSIITFLLVLVCPEIVKVASNKDYWGGISIVPLIIISYYYVFLYGFSVNIEFYMKKTFIIPIGTVLSALINIGLNYFFIPIYGIIAAAVSTIISYFFLFLFHHIIVYYILKIKVFRVKYYLLCILFSIITLIIFYIIKDFYVIRYLLFLSVLVYILLKYRKQFKSFIIK